MWDVLIAWWDVLIGWLSQNQNSGAVQALATGGLVLFAAVQMVVAFLARRDTKRLAKTAADQATATRAQVDASLRMAEEMREQRYDRYRPIVIIQPGFVERSYGKGPDIKGYSRVEATISNVGSGPALKLGFSFEPETGGKRLFAHALVAEEDINELGEIVQDAAFSSNLDDLVQLDSGAKRRCAFYWSDEPGKPRGMISLGIRGRFVADYVDAFDRKFQSILPTELLLVYPYQRAGTLSLVEV